MAYEKQTWKNLPDKTTPISAERLEHIEDGIYNNSVDVEDLKKEDEDIKEILEILPYVEEEGETITLDKTAKARLRSIELKGNTYQDSTSGKNLIYNANHTQDETLQGITYKLNSDGSISVSGTATGNYNYYLMSGLVLPAGTYTLSGGISDKSWVRAYDGTNYYDTTTNNIRTFTITEETSFSISLRITNGTTVSGTFYPMLESGSQATDYEPYTNGPAPNPDYPMPVHVVSGDNEIKVEGKNLFDKSKVNIGKGVSTANGTLYNNDDLFATDYIEITPNTSYSVNGYSSTANRVYGAHYDDSKTFLSSLVTSANISTFTVTNTNVKYIRLAGFNSEIDTYQLEKNTQVTPYQPYQSQTYPITLPEGMFLGWIGDYQDYIYKDNDKWYKYGAIGKVVLNGSENWSGNASSGFYTEFDTLLRTNDYNQKMLCNKFIIATNHTSQTFISNTITGYGGSGYAGQNWVYLKVEGITSASDLKTWLSSNNTTVYYVLETPTIEEITDTTLIQQLDDLEKAKSYKWQTNISQENNDEPFVINASAFLDLQLLLENS